MNNKILCFDVESNGLHGAGFAFGAVLLDENGVEESSIEGRCPIEGPVDPWVAKFVLPALVNMPVTRADAKLLRADFRYWFASRAKNAIVIADCGWPVEAKFLALCVDDDPEFSHFAPYPLHDVATLLLAAGMDPIGPHPPDDDIEGQKHHPLYDARCSARLARKVLLKMPAYSISTEKLSNQESKS